MNQYQNLRARSKLHPKSRKGGLSYGKRAPPCQPRGEWSLLIELLNLLDAAKGNPIKDSLIHPHQQSRGNHEFTIFVIDLVHCLSHRMGTGAKHLQLLTVMVVERKW
jgi:hypothetical protein